MFCFGMIYGLENLLNHKIYIGQTHRTLEERFSEHKHANSLIGRAIRKCGEENFVKVILEECENQEQLDACEIFWIARLNCMKPNGCNLTAGGKGSLGHKKSDETRARISTARKGKGHKLSAEHRQKLIAAHKGKPLSEELKKKLSAAKKGKPSPKKGTTLPPQIRAKISASLKAYYAKLKETK